MDNNFNMYRQNELKIIAKSNRIILIKNKLKNISTLKKNNQFSRLQDFKEHTFKLL